MISNVDDQQRREADPVLERIITALDGPWSEPDLEGNTFRLKEQGVIWQTQDNGKAIKRIETHLSNGIKTKMDPAVKAAVIGAAAVVIVALIPFVIATITGEPLPLQP